MATELLILGHNCDYYGVNASPGSVADAVRKVFEGSQQMGHGAAFLQYASDCGVVMPANRLCPYGASFPKSVAANPHTTLVDQLLRLIHELLAEGESHRVAYVLIHSLEITENPHNGYGLLVWAQMLNVNAWHLSPSMRSPKDCTQLVDKSDIFV